MCVNASLAFSIQVATTIQTLRAIGSTFFYGVLMISSSFTKFVFGAAFFAAALTLSTQAQAQCANGTCNLGSSYAAPVQSFSPRVTSFRPTYVSPVGSFSNSLNYRVPSFAAPSFGTQFNAGPTFQSQFRPGFASGWAYPQAQGIRISPVGGCANGTCGLRY